MIKRPTHVLFAVAVLVSGCATAPDPATPDRAALYQQAIVASAVPSEDAVAQLRTISGDEAVMVSWSGPYYEPGRQTLTFGALWATPSPQLRDMCRAAEGGASQARIEEMLGLPPGGGADRSFVVMRVNADDMFRPCSDPRIDQPTCPMDALSEPPSGVSREQWNADTQFVFAQMLSSYREKGYPFTRLGYTYDWSPESDDNVGPSEYVIRKGAEIDVLEVVPTEVYCAPASG